MLLELGLIAYAGLASLAAARARHWPARHLPGPLSPAIVRAIGVLLLAVSVVVAFRQFGPAHGLVAWTGELCVAGVALVLVMSWRFYAALKLGVAALLAALACTLLSLGG